MKAKNAIAWLCRGVPAITTLMVLVAAGVLFFSCRKDAAVVTGSSNNDMDNIARMVNASPLAGSIASASDEAGMAIVFNSGSKYVLLEKIAGIPVENVDEIRSAVLITSKYGVIIKDVKANKVWLFANNDEESLQKFEAMKQQLHSSFVSTTIFSSTVVQS